MKYAVLIPAYEPDARLVELCRALGKLQVPVLLVNDGSTVGLEHFEALKAEGFPVLDHAENRGKGRALKTGIDYLYQAGYEGVVTADADGQHTVEDILHIGAELAEHPGCLILGARDVSQMVPRSKAGNSLTRFLFRVIHGIDLQDTQTGLRGIPLDDRTAPMLLDLPGDRYEYEMRMLMESRTLFPAGVIETPIETIYIDDNASSHFRPLQDGMKIYSVLFGAFPKYLLSSLLSYAVDYSLFNLLYYQVLRQTVPSMVGARLVSSVLNYSVNKLWVFKGSGSKYNLLSYAALVAVVLAIGSGAMHLLVDVCGMPAFAMKLVVDCVLYVMNYFVQKKLAAL